MGPWVVCALCALLSLRLLAPELAGAGDAFRAGRERALLASVLAALQELEETLASGVVPSEAHWKRLSLLPEPWGGLTHRSLQELRSQGGALLPTLKRLRTLAAEQLRDLAEGRARASSALAQAAVCGALVPAVSAALYLLLPGIEGHEQIWVFGSALAMLLTLGGALWMLKLAETARWAGLDGRRRGWILQTACTGERFLALLRAGSPPDLAWGSCCEELSRTAPELAARWGPSIWGASPEPEDERAHGRGTSVSRRGPPALLALSETGTSIRRAVQASLFEGRACTERVESALQAFRSEISAAVERELGLLGTRVMKPLFLCVAPALLGMLGLALWLAFRSAVGGGLVS